MRELAAAYIAKGREQDLYLFVVTNHPNDKSFSSTTYAMLQELGQEQLMPQAQRTLAEDMLRKRSELAYLEANPTVIPTYKGPNSTASTYSNARLQNWKQRASRPKSRNAWAGSNPKTSLNSASRRR